MERIILWCKILILCERVPWDLAYREVHFKFIYCR